MPPRIDQLPINPIEAYQIGDSIYYRPNTRRDTPWNVGNITAQENNGKVIIQLIKEGILAAPAELHHPIEVDNSNLLRQRPNI